MRLESCHCRENFVTCVCHFVTTVCVVDADLFISNLQRVRLTEQMLQSEYKRVIATPEIKRQVQANSVRLPAVKQYSRMLGKLESVFFCWSQK